jgi:hypothetical protein
MVPYNSVDVQTDRVQSYCPLRETFIYNFVIFSMIKKYVKFVFKFFDVLIIGEIDSPVTSGLQYFFTLNS